VIISVPVQNGDDWLRIAVLISFTEGGNIAHVVVSTKSDSVGLNYVDNRDGVFHRQIEFWKQYPDSISESQRPLWYPVDITFRKPIDSFPITIAVTEDDQPVHSVTTYLRIVRNPAGTTAGSH
jgi:hypothetical protein